MGSLPKQLSDGALRTTTISTETHRKKEGHTHKLSDDQLPKQQHSQNTNSSSTRSSGTSTVRQVSPNDWVHQQDPSSLKQSTEPKKINYELQVKPNSSDSGHSSPSSSIDKTDKEFIPIPLSQAKPRSRPKSQHFPKE